MNTVTEELFEVTQAEMIPADIALLKLENETIQSLAAARPRDHHTIKAELIEQLEAYPSFAATAIYSKPVGRDQGGLMKYARGLSIRAAEAIAEAYGFNRVRCDVTPVDDNTVKVEATFTDYQKGRIWQSAGLVSKFYRSRGGKMTRIPDDRFYAVTVKAEESRRIREVILRSVPPGLRSELQELAEGVIDSLLDENTVNKILGQFSGRGVSEEVLEEYVGRTRSAGWTQEDRINLLGVWNAIEDGESTVSEVFGQLTAPKPLEETTGPSVDPVGVTAADLTGGEVVEETKKKKTTRKKSKKKTDEETEKKTETGLQRRAFENLSRAIGLSKTLEVLSSVIEDINLANTDNYLTEEQTTELVQLYAERQKSLANDNPDELF